MKMKSSEEALAALNDGKAVQAKAWSKNFYLTKQGGTMFTHIILRDEKGNITHGKDISTVDDIIVEIMKDKWRIVDVRAWEESIAI